MNFFKDSESFLTVSKHFTEKLVFTNGCFDILHVGHVRYLNQSKSLGDLLVVGLNSDNSVRTLKGADRPFNSEIDRAEVLLALSSVDYVVLFDEDTPFDLIKKIKPQVLTKGGDYQISEIVGADLMKENNGQVVVIPFVPDRSTTSLINKLINN